MKRILSIAFCSALACSGYSSGANAPTTTSAKVQPRPAPAPAAGQVTNSSEPLRTLVPATPSYQSSPVTIAVIPQKSDHVDLGITARLRTALLDDDTLSPAAKRVRIVTRDRKVVLEGRVPTARDLADVDAKARAFPGVVAVDNRVVVGP